MGKHIVHGLFSLADVDTFAHEGIVLYTHHTAVFVDLSPALLM
jgi:hypothetical protein